ncbi:uncharacterized protein LOC105212383 [Zeugodacus cucurbitae]|uniref:(S)-2-haloacid dehalogenase 4A n=1 Tax=Zeugodacus cucurbitae TaxID=28588 RepID=A0A0A1XEZ8_ZEUCU|nr:uncharacterized protein LOC105212383 [Zeugodacus cucurbitae]
MCVTSRFTFALLLLIRALLFSASEYVENISENAYHSNVEHSSSTAKDILNNAIPQGMTDVLPIYSKVSAYNDSVKGAHKLGSIPHNDEYLDRNQRLCFEKRSLLSCIKYKASKIIWMLATNRLGYFPNEYSRALVEDQRRVRVIQLGEPADIMVFNDARSLQGDSEFVSFLKFLKRAAETFSRNHAVQLQLSSETGARIVDSDVDGRSRHDRKRRKWLVILPLIILLKIAHLKMSVVTLLLGVLGLNVLLVGGMGWLIHYLKFKTLCKIHPHLVQSHSHVYDSDPADYSSFIGSSFPSSYYSGAGGGIHEANAKDWATSKAYHGGNYLDTISKRLK